MAKEQAAIPFKMLKVSADKEAFFVNLSEKQLESAPKFEFGRYDWVEDEAWREKNDKYYAPQQ
jgi:hypothetical protein